MSKSKRSHLVTQYSNIDVQNAVNNVLSKYTRINPLSNDQMSVVSSLINGENTIVSMPTGSGKSIPIFILPMVGDALNGVESDSVVLYLSPLVALSLSIASKLDEFGIEYTLIDESFDGVKPKVSNN